MRNSPTDNKRCSEASQLQANRQSSVIRFFVSLWSRIKLFLPTPSYKSCDCTCTSRSKRLPNNLATSDECFDADEVLMCSIPPCDNKSPSYLPSLSPSLCEPISLNVPTETFVQIKPHFAESCTVQELDLSDEAYIFEYDLLQHTQFKYFSNEYQLSDSIELISSEVSLLQSIPLKIEIKASFNKVLLNDFTPIKICCRVGVMDDSIPLSSTTVTSNLYNKLKNGEISHEEYRYLFDSVVVSVIPRNLSDTIETQYPADSVKTFLFPSSASIEYESETSNLLMNMLKPLHVDHSKTAEYYVESLIEGILSDSINLTHDVEGTSEEHSVIFRHIEDSVSLDTTGKYRNNSTCEPIAHTPADKSMFMQKKSYSSGYYLDLPNREYFTLDAKGQLPDDASPILRSKRSSSLKSEKSPISTPSRKIVRFADSLGLDLETVRHVLDQENPPKIPASATLDLHLDSEKSLSSIGAKQFQLCFPQPGASPNFLHHVLQDGVSLESARVDSSRGLLTGTIRVRSFGFEKNVSVRVSYNNWNTFCEIKASYVQDSYDGVTDKFSFSVIFPSTIVADEKVQFAVRYETHTGSVFWDSNHGENYVISCYAKATDMAGDGSWLHFL